ncbi:MAG: hypothetical protein PHC53_02645 [Patescibacteria group bacterium]|nr:hypothetical protein [Patescibacteria group bacterium]
MSTYTITKIDKALGHVSVIYSVDGVEQTMCDCPLDSEEATKAFLEDYGNRYESAKALEAETKVVPQAVADLEGQTFDVPVGTVEAAPEEVPPAADEIVS